MTTTVEFIPDTAGINELVYGSSGSVYALIERLTMEVADLVRATAPVASGTLQASIDWRVESLPEGPTGFVVANTSYAIIVAQGSVPHEIVPVNARVLRFPSSGIMVFTKHVDHPGTQPNNWMIDALETVIGGMAA